VEAAPEPPRPSRKEEVRLYGLNAIQAVFDRRPQAIRKIYLLQSRVHALKRLLAWCVQQRVGYRVVEEDDLNRLTGSAHHEGVAADVLRVEPLGLEAWLAQQPADAPRLAIWLDGVGNPHNFGAILRSAAHFGASVLLPAGSGLALSGAAARVAEGGAEAVTLVRLPDTDTALARLRQAGFELAATVVRDGQDLFAAPAPARRVYVMGAEGEGMDAQLAQACDRRLSIPGTGSVESLNVAAATAVFLARWAAERARR
jgi:TrmH RNA methyltransferase